MMPASILVGSPFPRQLFPCPRLALYFVFDRYHSVVCPQNAAQFLPVPSAAFLFFRFVIASKNIKFSQTL